MRIPSIKTLCSIMPVERAKLVHERCERYRERCKNHPSANISVNHCLNYCSAIMEQFGYEKIPAGRNQKSPAIEYVNTGDPYTNTLLFVNGNFSVGNWGSIVERGNYE